MIQILLIKFEHSNTKVKKILNGLKTKKEIFRILKELTRVN